MSVLKSRRNVSNVQFLDTARELAIFTLQRCRKFPKSWTFYFSVPIWRLAQEVLNKTKAANGIYPQNAHERQMRRDCLIEANAALQEMISQLNLAKDAIDGVPDKVWQMWMELADREAKLISAVQKRDLERYKDLV